MTRRLPLLLLFLASLLGSAAAQAELVVVIGTRSSVMQLNADEVINIFLGRYRRLPDGSTAVPVDQPAGSSTRAEFYRRLVNKEVSEINAYWARLHFSGKTTPPLQASSAADVIGRVAGTPGGIGYLERSQVDARVRVVMTLPD